MGNLLLSILICNPLKHTTATLIVKIDINIGQRDTVRVQETLKQQVVLNRVNLCNSETVCHSRARCRTSTRSNPDIELLTRCRNKVLNDKEVTRETHRLHNMKLELQSLRCLIVKHLAITLLCAYHCKVCKVICLKLDTIEAIITA